METFADVGKRLFDKDSWRQSKQNDIDELRQDKDKLILCKLRRDLIVRNRDYFENEKNEIAVSLMEEEISYIEDLILSAETGSDFSYDPVDRQLMGLTGTMSKYFLNSLIPIVMDKGDNLPRFMDGQRPDWMIEKFNEYIGA